MDFIGLVIWDVLAFEKDRLVGNIGLLFENVYVWVVVIKFFTGFYIMISLLLWSFRERIKDSLVLVGMIYLIGHILILPTFFLATGWGAEGLTFSLRSFDGYYLKTIINLTAVVAFLEWKKRRNISI